MCEARFSMVARGLQLSHDASSSHGKGRGAASKFIGPPAARTSDAGANDVTHRRCGGDQTKGVVRVAGRRGPQGALRRNRLRATHRRDSSTVDPSDSSAVEPLSLPRDPAALAERQEESRPKCPPEPRTGRALPASLNRAKEAHMGATVIALFNHKGGVSKTTTTFNLGWMLAEQGKRVVMVDADSQCNLTGMVLGYKGPTELEAFYEANSARNLWAGLAPAFESQPRLMEGVDCLPVDGRDGLYLLPGHIGISEYEVTLGIAQELSGSIQTLQNLPGAPRSLIDLTAARMDADYVLIDMSPGLGAMNQNLFVTSDNFIIPNSPDFFSMMAVDSLARVIPRWQEWGRRAHSLTELRTAVYPFIEPHTKFLGTVIQRYRPRGGAPASAFQSWINGIEGKIEGNLLPVFVANDMVLPAAAYEALNIGAGRCLAQIPDFNSLIAKSQEFQTPVFALTDQQIGQVGVVLDASTASRDAFHQTFSDLATEVAGLAEYAPAD